MNSLLSVVIPSRNEKYLKNTILDLLDKASGRIEIIAVLDGCWSDIVEDERVIYIHFTKSKGMRNAINSAVSIARGKYIMKTDGHCLFDKGFDEKLMKDCEKNWIVIPRRYALDAENWKIEERTDNKYPIDVMDLNKNLQGIPTNKRKDNSIIDTPSFQGSCWFMHKDYFHELKLMDDKTYGSFWQEAQEMSLKCEQNGGRVVRNTHTWYAHYHKTKGRGYSLQANKHETKKAIKELYDKR